MACEGVQALQGLVRVSSVLVTTRDSTKSMRVAGKVKSLTGDFMLFYVTSVRVVPGH